MSINNLTLARKLTERVNLACEGLQNGSAEILGQVSDTTAELLRWWFQQDYCDTRNFNFHAGQRQAILNTIYAHEVLGITSLAELYKTVAADVMLENDKATKIITHPRNAYPKYCMKMATGTGKTWVLQALLIWQVLNANRDRESPKYTRNFLLVAPGLIVYERLLDAFMGKERSGKRDFTNSDIYKYQSLFIPESNRDEIFRFVQGTVCPKEEIGRKVTSGGLIAISNWHLLSEEEEPDETDDITAPGVAPDPDKVVQDLLPLMPGVSAGNDLNQLNRKFERGGILNYLKDLTDLMVFNDEAHHIHDFKKEGEVFDVEWQKSLNLIAESKGRRFVQVDFSATPYNQVGTGKNITLTFFPHIIVDFDLKTAMRMGLVKSLVLDKRKEIGALPDDELEFKAYRDDDNNPTLSEGQRIMLRAGLTKLKKLESEFAVIDPQRCPKMLVMCEDTTVTPLVESFLKDEGLPEDEILRVDSNRKGDLKKEEWDVLREKLFDMDAHKNPRVVISVLMLREGFDVNNICVIVPLRSSQARILLEQTIGRGLRLMWRADEFEDTKRDNRRLIKEGKSPQSMIDVLSIVEHPAFQQFYDDLMQDGLAGTIDDKDDNTSSTGDLISVGLRGNYQQYDFAIPFILRESEEMLGERHIDIGKLAPFTGFTVAQLKSQLGHGEKFHSVDVQTKTQFGTYRVSGGMMNATGYNDYIARIVLRITEILNQPATGNTKPMPFDQTIKPQLAAWIDQYIRKNLFGHVFAPMEDENWRILLLDMVSSHIAKEFAVKLIAATENEPTGDVEVTHRLLSEVPKLAMRQNASIAVDKCIYTRLPYPSRAGGLEQSFIEMANRDGDVEAFCKISEHKHDFVRLRYIKEEGLPAFYHPDFLVRIGGKVYLVETKAQEQLAHPNVKRKRRAAVAWCDRINALPPAKRGNAEWVYVLLGEAIFYDWRNKNANMHDMLEFAKLRGADYLVQGRLI